MRAVRFRETFKVMFRIVSYNGKELPGCWREYGYTPMLYTRACEEAEKLRGEETALKLDGAVIEYEYRVAHQKFVVGGRLVDGRRQQVA